MKRLGKIVVCLVSGLVLNAGARADDRMLSNNPYAPIVVRNIFGLNPPLPADADQSVEPPPKITPNGIMSIFGQLQVLFKVTGTAKPGQPAKDDSYILSEGQRQDEIEVIHIDEKAGLVTFNNHGTVQELSLVKASALALNTPMPSSGRAGPNRNLTAPNGENSGRGRSGGDPADIPSRARNRGPGNGSNNYNNGVGNGSPLTTAPTSAGFSNPQQPQNTPQSTLSPEAQLILIEAQRAQWEKEGNPAAAIIPPTMLTPRNRGAENSAGGMPPIP
jgi:hypothetical protein